jgi:hypothetical protein
MDFFFGLPMILKEARKSCAFTVAQNFVNPFISRNNWSGDVFLKKLIWFLNFYFK